MESSSQRIRNKISSNSMEINQGQVNSHNDFRQLPRSSGDGMESGNSSPEKDIEDTNNGPITKNVGKDLTLLSSTNTLHGSQPAFDDSASPMETSLRPTPDRCAAKDTFKQSDSEASSSYSETPINNSFENTHCSFVTSQAMDGNVDHNNELFHGAGNDNALEPKLLSLERKAECLDLQSLIKDLENRNQKLAAEKEKLTNKLGVQIKVNADLKKLLVASVGEDIGARLEEMSINKAQFDTTLTNLQTEVQEVSDELGRVSIECDVWRSKFLASRMMTSGLTDIKTTLFMKHRNCQAALEKLLEEQSDIRQHLRATNRLLQGVHRATDKPTKKNALGNTFEKSSIIELAHINYNLAEDICFSVNLSHFYATVNNTSSVEEELIPVTDLTPAERLACQVLKSDADERTNMDLVMQKMGRQYIGNSYVSRFLTNNFRVTFDCCDRCTGTLEVV